MATRKPKPKPGATAPSTEYKGRSTAGRVLHRVLHSGAYVNIVLNNTLADESLSPGDRRMTTLLVYGVLRNLRLLDEVFRSKTKRGKITASPTLLLTARMAIFEILFLKKTPKYATISEYMNIASNDCSKQETKFLNACLRRVSRKDIDLVLDETQNETQRLALEFSCPNWFLDSVLHYFGREETRKMLRANNLGMPTYYRVNTLRTTTGDILDKYGMQHLDVLQSKTLRDCIYFKAGQAYHPDSEFQAGLLTPQDFSTQIMAHAVDPRPGQSVLDLCCGRGTKTTHLAELMENKGSISACDIHAHKTSLLKDEAARLGIDIINATVADATKPAGDAQYDRVLLDVPCSGTGVFRRKPELKQRLNPADIIDMVLLQRRLLESAAARVKPGGRLVYATCSVLPEENDDVAASFLEKHEEFKAVRNAPCIAGIPCFQTPFGTIFLPHQVQACGAAVYILDKEA